MKPLPFSPRLQENQEADFLWVYLLIYYFLTVTLCHICDYYLYSLTKNVNPLPYHSETQSLYYKSPTGRQAGVSVQLMNCFCLDLVFLFFLFLP